MLLQQWTSRAGPWCWTQVHEALNMLIFSCSTFMLPLKALLLGEESSIYKALLLCFCSFSRWPPPKEESPDVQAPNPRDVGLPGFQCVHNRHLSRGQSMLSVEEQLIVFGLRTRWFFFAVFTPWFRFNGPFVSPCVIWSYLDVSRCHQCLVSLHKTAVWALPIPADCHLSGSILWPGICSLVPVQVNRQLWRHQWQRKSKVKLSFKCWC